MMNPSTAQALAVAHLADLHQEAARRRTARLARASRAGRAARTQTGAAALIPAQPKGHVQLADAPDERTLCLSGIPESALR